MFRVAMYFEDAQHSTSAHYFSKSGDGTITQNENDAITHNSASEAEDYVINQTIGTDNYFQNMGYIIEHQLDNGSWEECE